MRLKNVKIQNYRSLHNVEFKDLSNLVILVGKNSSGKTNLLEALWLFSKDFALLPDTITINAKHMQALCAEYASRNFGLPFSCMGNATVERETPLEQREVPALSDDQVAELAALGQRIESHYGEPQDIEWAYAQGRLYVLQSRPITAVPVKVPWDNWRPTCAPSSPSDWSRKRAAEESSRLKSFSTARAPRS